MQMFFKIMKNKIHNNSKKLILIKSRLKLTTLVNQKKNIFLKLILFLESKQRNESKKPLKEK